MKKQKSISTQLSLSLILASSLFVGCQKASDDKPAAKAPILLDAEKQVPAVVCSPALMKLIGQFRDNQTKTNEYVTGLQADSSNSKLRSSLSDLKVKQGDTCKAITAQFSADKSASCLKSDSEKTIANSFYQSDVEISCATEIDKLQKLKLPKSTLISEKKESALVLRFNDNSQSLIQTKTTADFTYLAKRSIKHGLEQFKQDILEGTTTCAFQTSAESSLKETQFTTISEIPGSAIDLGFEFKGSRFSLALEDTQKMMLSMTCYNMTIVDSSSKRELLQKAFGDLIAISDKVVIATDSTNSNTTDPLLNTEVAPKVPVATKEEIDKTKTSDVATAADDKQKKSNEAVDSIVTKAKETMHEVVKDTLTEIKATSAEVRAETIVEAKKAAQEVADETIVKATAAAKEVSKAAAQDAQVAANQVVKQSIATVKLAIADTVKAPFVYVAKKAVQVKDAVVKTAKKAVNYVEDKAIEVKNYISDSLTSKDYWSSFFASKDKK